MADICSCNAQNCPTKELTLKPPDIVETLSVLKLIAVQFPTAAAAAVDGLTPSPLHSGGQSWENCQIKHPVLRFPHWLPVATLLFSEGTPPPLLLLFLFSFLGSGISIFVIWVNIS